MLRLKLKTRPKVHWLLPVLGIGLILWSIHAVWHVHNASKTESLTGSGGQHWTRRHQFACALAEHAAGHGLDIHLTETAGSIECLEQLETGELDFAMISGSLDAQRYPHVRQVAHIGFEALHLLVKRVNIEPGATPDLSLLRGKRVNIGAPGSGSNALARELINFAGIATKATDSTSGLEFDERGTSELVKLARAIAQAPDDRRAALTAQMPDAIFVLNVLPSVTVSELLSAVDFTFIPLPYAQPFRLNGSHLIGQQMRRIDRNWVERAEIPAHTYGVSPAHPGQVTETLGVGLLVVVRHDIPLPALHRLIDTLYEGDFAHEMPPRDLLEKGSEYPLHPAVEAHLLARRPMMMKDFMEIVQKCLSAVGAFSAGGFAVFGYYRGKRKRDPYLTEIGRIDRIIHGHESAEHSNVAELFEQLEDQLARLKLRAIEDYATGRLKDEIAFANLLALIADTRQGLIRRNRSNGPGLAGALAAPPVAATPAKLVPRRRNDAA